MTDFKTLTQKIIDGYQISQAEAREIAAAPDKEALYSAADTIRKHFMGNKIDTCSIMNARSGRCSENCKWCSQSKFHSTNIEVYPFVALQDALAEAHDNDSKGVGKFSLVTSGRTLSATDLDKACEIYRTIGKTMKIRICASMGLLTKADLQQLKDSGVEHYHCNLETAPSYFPTLCTTHTIDEKLQTIKWAQEVGLKICSGGIIGMGESMDQRIELAITLRDTGVVSIPVNVLNPIEGTPLAGTAKLSDEEILTTFAIFRLINPTAHIRFAGGRNLFAHIAEKALQSGVNAALVGDLLTTLGSKVADDKEMFKRCGYSL